MTSAKTPERLAVLPCFAINDGKGSFDVGLPAVRDRPFFAGPFKGFGRFDYSLRHSDR